MPLILRLLISVLCFTEFHSEIECSEEEQIPVLVNRRVDYDIVTYMTQIVNSSNFESSLQSVNCDNHTYIVNERRCVNNRDLMNVCRLSITPVEERSNPTIVLRLNHRNSDSEVTVDLKVTDSSGVLSDALIVTNDPQSPCCSQVVNTSFCHITSLEVYRGEEDVFRIHHDGFFLSDIGTIEVNQSQLAYSVEKFLGELYRMNLSCSGGGLPESGCLFFKVWGTTNITNAKFGHTVPGTLHGLDSQFTATTISTLIQTDHDPELLARTDNDTASNDSTHSMSILDTSPFNPITGFILYFALAAAGVLTLSLVTIVLCTVFVYCLLSNSKIKNQRQSDTQEEASSPLANLFCEQSDLMSVIPLAAPVRQTVPTESDNNRPVYSELSVTNRQSPDHEVTIPHCNYDSNPAYKMHAP